MKLLRRGMAMLLSITLVFSLVSVVASPNWTSTKSLGKLSRYYETGNVDDEAAAGVISTVAGDPGGKSYGAYMFASKAGTVKSFINWCLSKPANTATYSIGETLQAAYYSGGEGCGPLFDQAWTNLAARDSAAFFDAQEKFVEAKIYDETIALIRVSYPNFNVNYYSVALKNVIWSRAVHHGPSGAAKIVKEAFTSLGGFANQAEGDLIMAIYNESGKVVDSYENADKMNGSLAAKYNVDGKVLRYWFGSSPGVQLAVYRRLQVNEPNDALSMMQANAFVSAPLSEGNYTITVRKDSSTLALGVIDETAKVVTTTGENPGTPAKFTLNFLSGANAYTINTTLSNGKTMRLAATTGSDGFGTVSLSNPGYSDSQLWLIDNDGKVKNKATGTYLSFRNDTLVVVADGGADTTQTVMATASGSDKAETFTPESPATPSDLVKSLTVKFATGNVGAITANSTAAFEVGSSSDFVVKQLPTVTPNSGWTFVGWFDQNGSKVDAPFDTSAGELTLYAKYTATSKITPAAWIFSPVVEKASDITVRHLIYPDANTELHEDDSGFPVRGMISCSAKIDSVTLKISGSTISRTATVDAHYYDLSNLDSKISYSSLDQGTYTYELSAKVGGTSYLLEKSQFTVGATVVPDVTTPSVGDKFTVTFDAGNKGTSAYTKKTYALDDIVYGELPSVNVKSNSVEFVGWFTADGVQVLPGTAIVAENITLYARYTNEYTYTFLKANGSNYRSGSAAAGTVFTAPATAPTKAPDSNYTYTFSHWVDEAGKRYASSQSIVMGEDNMTFTPVYTKEARPSDSGSSSSGGGSNSDSSGTPSGTYWTLTPGVSISQMEGTVYSNGKVVTDGNLATGMIVKVDGEEFEVSVTGDMSGDGKITVTDVVKLQSHLLNKASLSGAYLKAADLNGDSKVSITDLVKSARVVAGKDTIG